MKKNMLTAGNSTMPTNVGIFNLPALKTCTPSPWCKEHCYALKGRFLWSPIKKAYAWRLKESKKDSFVYNMICEIKRRHFNWIRVHISGDFYSKEYVDKWAIIAEHFPQIVFRTNTKRVDLLKYMKRVLPNNFVVRESVDNSRLSSRIFSVAAIRYTAGTHHYFECHNDCEECKFHCWVNPLVNVVTGKIL
jgi:hypothetical protein